MTKSLESFFTKNQDQTFTYKKTAGVIGFYRGALSWYYFFVPFYLFTAKSLWAIVSGNDGGSLREHPVGWTFYFSLVIAVTCLILLEYGNENIVKISQSKILMYRWPFTRVPFSIPIDVGSVVLIEARPSWERDRRKDKGIPTYTVGAKAKDEKFLIIDDRLTSSEAEQLKNWLDFKLAEIRKT
jgi:hypothetical protein